MSLSSTTAAQATALVEPGHRVFVQGAAATPNVLLRALEGHAERFRSAGRPVELVHLHTEGPAHYADERFRGAFSVVNLFVGGNVRAHLSDRVDFLPCMLSEMPGLLREGPLRPEVALVHVSPPDSRGLCTLGTGVDATRAAVDTARLVIAQVNPRMPRTHGDTLVPTARFAAMVHVDEPLPEGEPHALGPEAERIGAHVAGHIPDGATLQLGIGAIPDAVLHALRDHRHLGLHTEMFSDGVLELFTRGVVDNSRKRIHAGRSVATFLSGSARLLEFVHDNPEVLLLDAAYVNSPQVISRNPNVRAINSLVEIDLSGQVCADSVGTRIVSGVGGQLDFVHGAALSAGGASIFAFTARTPRGTSRIVPQLHAGAGVVTPRALVDLVATEYGVASLRGRTLAQRARALIELAAPEDREALECAARATRLLAG